jgi:hypothetical protein
MTRFALFITAALAGAPAAADPLPPLNPPPAAWCTLVPTPGGVRPWSQACMTIDQWQTYVKIACLTADAIGKPDIVASSRCLGAKMSLDKVMWTARAAQAAYDKALAARQALRDMGVQ